MVLSKKDYDSNVKRIVKAIMKQGMDEFGMCVIKMSDALVEEVMRKPDKKSKDNYYFHINCKLRDRGWKDEDGVKWYYRVTSIEWSQEAVNEEGCNCLIFYLDEEYTSY